MCKQIALYIDGDSDRQRYLSNDIEPYGFKLHKVATVLSAKEILKNFYYPLILMRLEAIDKEITEFCSFVRFISAQAVVMALMANVSISVEERLFDCGISDVVVGKRASAGLLARRIRVHFHNNKTWSKTNIVMLKNMIISFDRREVWCNGTTRRLPGILADLLKYFLDNPNRTITRLELCNCPIWADSICSSPDEGGKTFDVNIGKLRKIIEPDPGKPQIIESVRGLGWKLARP